MARTLQARAMRQGYFRLVLWSEGMPADGSGRTGYLSIEIAEWTQEEVQTGGRDRGTGAGAAPDAGRGGRRTGAWGEPYESGGSVNGFVDPTERRRPQLLAGGLPPRGRRSALGAGRHGPR